MEELYTMSHKEIKGIVKLSMMMIKASKRHRYPVVTISQAVWLTIGLIIAIVILRNNGLSAVSSLIMKQFVRDVLNFLVVLRRNQEAK